MFHTGKIAGLFFLFLVFVGAGVFAEVPATPWDQGMGFGTGIDVLTGKLKTASEAVTWNSIDEPVCHHERELEFRLISDKNELQSTVGFELGAKIDVIVATASGSIGATYANDKSETSIFILIKASHKECSYNMNSPEMKKDAQTLYFSDNNAFRTKYGDAFLSTITTGGTFYGVAEIKHKTVEDKAAFEVQLKAKVLGVTVFKKVIRKTLYNLSKTANISFDVIVNGHIQSTSSVDYFFRQYDNFLTETASEKCQGSSGYMKCPYKTGYFEDYSILTKETFSDTLLDTAGLNITLMENKMSALLDILAALEKVKKNKDGYFFQRSKTTGESFSEIFKDVEKQVKDLYLTTFNKNRSCRNNYFVKEGNLKKLNSDCEIENSWSYMDDIKEINKNLPQKKLPSDCMELQNNYKMKFDGVYTLYVNNEGHRFFKAYCRNMDSEFPAETYLLLPAISPVSGNPDHNYSKYVNYMHETLKTETTLTTVFHGYLIEKYSEDVYEIVMGQNFYLASHGGSIKVKTAYGGTDILYFTVAGYPSVCNNSDELDESIRRIANMNLSGSPFAFDIDESDFKIYGNLKDAQVEITMDAQKKNLEIKKTKIGPDSCIAVRAERLLIKYGK